MAYFFISSEFYKVLPEGQYSYTLNEKNKVAKEITVFIERDKVFSNGNYTVVE